MSNHTEATGSVPGGREQIPRSLALDIARGLAVLGVVLNHTIGGLSAADVISYGSPWLAVNDALIVGRMPAMFFLIGLFIPRSVAKRGAWGYIRERSAILLWVYLVWYVIQSSAEYATSSLKNTPVPASILWELWSPIAHLWFLPMLALGTLAVVISRVWRHPLALVIFAFVSLACWGWRPPLIGFDGLGNLAFLALGAVVGLPRMVAFLERRTMIVVVGITCAVAYAGLLSLGAEEPRTGAALDIVDRVVSFGAALVAIPVLFGMSALLALIPRLADLLGWVGTRTIGLYASHIVFMAGLRIVLMKAGLSDEHALVLLVCLGAAVLALGFQEFANRVGLTWLFTLPAPWLAHVRTTRESVAR
ncbi:MAG: acyltransferase [Bowdeniella nasicola]|nr:acyltransferase [Bowdeniella nasicola]